MYYLLDLSGIKRTIKANHTISLPGPLMCYLWMSLWYKLIFLCIRLVAKQLVRDGGCLVGSRWGGLYSTGLAMDSHLHSHTADSRACQEPSWASASIAHTQVCFKAAISGRIHLQYTQNVNIFLKKKERKKKYIYKISVHIHLSRHFALHGLILSQINVRLLRHTCVYMLPSRVIRSCY